MEAPPLVEGATCDASMQLDQAVSAENDKSSSRQKEDDQIVISSEPNSPAKPAQGPASAAKSAKAGSQTGAAASQQGKSASNAGSGKKRGRPAKKSLEAAAAGCGKGLSAFLITPAKKPKTEEVTTPAVSGSGTPANTTPPQSDAKKASEPVGNEVVEGASCRYMVDGAFVRAKVVGKDDEKNMLCLQLGGTEEQRWVAADSKDLTICGAKPMALGMESETAKEEGKSKKADEEAEEEAEQDRAEPALAPAPADNDFMVIDSNSNDGAAAPSSAGSKPTSEDTPPPPSATTPSSSSKEKEASSSSSSDSAKTPSTVKKVAKAPKKIAVNSAEKQKQNERLQEELCLLSKMKFTVPYLLPSDQELADEINCATVCQQEQPVPLKTRQVVARVICGSAQSSAELAALLLEKASNKPEEPAALQGVQQRLEEIVGLVGEHMQFCPSSQEPHSEESAGLGNVRCNVRDIADIPAEFRALVETQHKMQHMLLGGSVARQAYRDTVLREWYKFILTQLYGAAVRDRMEHLQKMTEEHCAKELAKMDKALLGMKDKFVKMEEKEKKEREKLEAKMEKEKEKMEAKLEREREKTEAERKKQEEKNERQRIKDEEARLKKEKEDKEDGDKAEDDSKPEKTKGAGKGKGEKGKDTAGTVKQASFMANFFKKASSTPAPPIPPGHVAESSAAAASSSSSSSSSSKGGDKGGEQGLKDAAAPVSSLGIVTKAVTKQVQTQRNFHPWEPPKHAVIAALPFGPGGEHAPAGPSPEQPDLQSWLAELRKVAPRYRKSRPVREDGREHPKMKLIQLNMKLPVVRTQLVDVDVDASHKIVWDVEEDNAEEKLTELLAECDETEDGLYKFRGRTLQMLTEGGGWFDCRRPPFHGTIRKTSAHISGTKPLAQDPELDYAYESEVDWESEAGDGEDLGSDLDGDDDEEEMEDDEGGFVVPDGMVMDEEDPEGGVMTVRKLKKLQQIVYYADSVPQEFAVAMSVQIVDVAALVLENDSNLVLEKDIDYYGDDLGSTKAANIEQAIHAVHKHALACAFTYIPADHEHRFAGVVFLKGKGAQAGKQAGEGLVSGYLKDIPKSKRIAIRKAAEDEAAEKAAEAAERAKKQKLAPEPKSKRLAKKQEAKAAGKEAEEQQAAAEEASARLAAAAVDNAVKAEGKDKPKKGGDKAAAASKIVIPDNQLLKLVKLVHGSGRSKVELAREFMALFPEVAKSKADKYVSGLFLKKDGRHAIVEERLANPFVAEVAADAWKANTASSSAAQGSGSGGGGVQLTFKAMPKPLSA